MEPFVKSLECLCAKPVTGTEEFPTTCPGGGEFTATIGLQEAALFATIESKSNITSPGESLTCELSNTISGDGPYYILNAPSANDFTYGCQHIEPGWTATITGVHSGDVAFILELEIKNVYDLEASPYVGSNGKYLVFYDGEIDLKGEGTNISSIIANGFGSIRPPEATLTKTFGGVSIDGEGQVDTVFSAAFGLPSLLQSQGVLDEAISVAYALDRLLDGEGLFTNTYTDKVHGDFSEHYCQGFLYPSGDLPIQDGFGSFVGPEKTTTDLWTYLDEGVYQGRIKVGGDSVLLSDDLNTFIEPDTIHTEGLFQYRCELTELHVRPDHSSFRIRAAAPLHNYESRTPPLYTIYNIKLSDPSGHTIVKYNDIQLRGDYDDDHSLNFATYSSLPETNIVAEKYDWERNIPYMYETSGYRLAFSVRAVSLDDPFDPGFDAGFEENYIIPEQFYASGNNYLALDGQPLSTQEVRFLNPTRGFRISAIEICNSGGFGPRKETALNFNVASREKGIRLERSISPTFMHLSDYDTSIYPSVTTNIWEDDTSLVYSSPLGITNEDSCGAKKLLEIIQTKNEDRHIKLQTADGGGVADSGKLLLKFSLNYGDVDEITPGAFNFQFDQGTKNTWWSPSGAFNVENRNRGIQKDLPFFDVDSITLKVMAKKAVGSRDYALDVVGYSDDKLLNVTPASGGFIQDPSGAWLNDTFISNVGQHPVLSGFYQDSSDWTIGGAGLSERDDYFEASGNDHYKLAQYPMVTGTEFALYEVPLVILDDQVRLGLSRDYSLSSLLENVYLDIYPLPSGASIAHIELCVRYAPANGINLYSYGGAAVGKTQDGRSEAALYPTVMSSVDNILNAGSGYQPISWLRDLPHLYSSPDTIKTNYSRRWRGAEGTVRGPYDLDAFSFGFTNPTIDYPFLSGYFKFDNIEDGYVKSVDMGPDGLGTASGLLSSNLEVYHNVGWRFTSASLFSDHLPGFSGNYTTTDWTSLSNGATTFVGNPLYGKIADAFDRVVRISGEAGIDNINFGNIDTASGFALFVRFTPDSNVSGVDYNLFDSGVIFAKWDDANNMDFALGYKDGYLCGYAQDDANNIIEVVDTVEYSGYQFPLNAILTYNDNASRKLKLYTDNEFINSFDVLRASSDEFDKNTTNADIVLGYAAGSGVGMNMLVSEFGISAYSSGVRTLYGAGTNIVEAYPDKTYKRVTAETVLENSRVKYFNPDDTHEDDRYKLWDRVNEDTYNDWNLGAFKYCQFSIAFEQWQDRPNSEHIFFTLKHHGSGYSQYSDLPLLSNINSDVSYHTQMENDFLRFHLSDAPNNFRCANRRISKNLPVGYKFSEKALCVETVLEHKTDYDIQWSGCEENPPIGPRLIVSLYTESQEPYWTTDEPNWGLVTRKIHYLEPSSCIMRLDSVFSYADMVDETEEWSIFPSEPRLKDFTERYFKDDVDRMFVQYDLVYPSGPAYESRIEMHSSHVRMAEASVFALDSSGAMNLNISGAFPASGQLNLIIPNIPHPVDDFLPITMQVPMPYDIFDGGLASGFALSVSGAVRFGRSLNLFTPNQSGNFIFNLNVSGAEPSSASGSMNLALPKVLGSINNGNNGGGNTGGGGGGPALFSLFSLFNFDEPEPTFGFPLVVHNSEVTTTPDGPVLNLNMTACSEGSQAIISKLPLLLFNNHKSTGGDYGDASGQINLSIFAENDIVSTRRSHTMPLRITAPNIINTNMPLYLQNEPTESLLTSSMNLTTASYSSTFGSAFGLWDSNNYGVGIDITDNHLAFLPVDNEIRGVDLIGYGSCTGDSPSKAIDEALRTDCTIWREATCNDGGVFRAKGTYTNPDAINFDGELGYSGNYYGIRKYNQLLPASPYMTTITIRTGATTAIPVPRTFEEWEYGMCGPAWHESGCCTVDCEDNIVFSGVKLIGDDACGVPPSSNLCVDPELILASGRNANDKYGRTVKVNGDLMGIAAPNMTIPDYSPYDDENIEVLNAGAVFLYRRGEDEAGKKADWRFIEQLMLPSGFRGDYIQRTQLNMVTFNELAISGNKWQIGQEGRHFGESLSLCSSGDREVVAVGAPRASWSREFGDLTTSGIPTACVIVADLFSYDKKSLQSVAGAAEKFNKLWKYFSAPWNAGPDEWYPEIKPKVIVFQLAYSDRNYPVVPTDESSWFTHRYIPRLDDLDLLVAVGSGALGGSGTFAQFRASGQPIVFNQMFSGIKDGFFTAFPSGSPAYNMYSGIPAILGMFREETGSTAGALRYRNANGDSVSLYDEFEKFYLAHSYASGVRDLVQDIAQSGHIYSVSGKSEEWDTTTRQLLSDTFDSGRLGTTYTNSTLNRNFISSGVGQEWGDTHISFITELQQPPASGGRVYVFEKERENFNCVQVLYSPNDASEFDNVNDPDSMLGAGYGRTYNDRFGHSVSISKNGEVLAVGSPWIDKACKIFERQQGEINKVYSSKIREWCVLRNRTAGVEHYDAILRASGELSAATSTYDHIEHSDRFEYRNDLDFWGVLPAQYALTYEYGYGDIKYVGTRQYLPSEFAPTSRLGWSCSVDEDGEVVAFGAPTDSFNEFEDVNVWGDTIKSWASYNNAGAVRMFHNRKYYPHSEVVEFGRFGNLDRAMHPVEMRDGFYDESNWPLIFGSGADGTVNYTGHNWRRMRFSEVEIPRDAGLAFIITPELNAASDEIVQNIKDWLALGDRNLVLVGNDPIWEENGIYSDSNDIINDILEKLGSRMRIQAAKDESYSMQGCVSLEDVGEDLVNATGSFLPKYSTGRTIESDGGYYVKGVGDIRIDLSRDNLGGYFESLGCPEGATCEFDADPPIINTRCEFPLIGSGGDLRAEWLEECTKTEGDKCKVVRYSKNWPFMFNNYTVDCDEAPQPLFLKNSQEPVPVLTTAEHLPLRYWYEPETSGLQCEWFQPQKYEIRRKNEERKTFAKDNIDELAFSIAESGDSVVAGIFNLITYGGDMRDPDPKNGRDGIIQATGTSFAEVDARKVSEEVYPDHILGLMEHRLSSAGRYNGSRVFIMATQWSEDDASRGITYRTENEDKNTEFYINMVRKDCQEAPKGIQLNGFTGRTSLNNAYFLTGDDNQGHRLGSYLNGTFLDGGGYFKENQELTSLNSLVDFLWIANPAGKPSQEDLDIINNWLDLGSKKVIITYNTAQTSRAQDVADNVAYLCSGIKIDSRPMFFPRANEYYLTTQVIERYTPESERQIINYNNESISGCDTGYAFTSPNYSYRTNVPGLEFHPSSAGDGNTNQGSSNDGTYDYFEKAQMVPLSGGGNFERIISYGPAVKETYTVYDTKNTWKIDGDAAVTFPIQPGSGYRVWVNWVSETSQDKFSICLNPSGDIELNKGDEDNTGTGSSGGGNEVDCGLIKELKDTEVRSPRELIFDFYTEIEKDVNEFGLIFSTDKWRNFISAEDLDDAILPVATPRILSISGALLPVIIERNIVTTSGLVDDGPPIQINCRYQVNPARSGLLPRVSRPVSHKTEIYCPDLDFTTDKCVSASLEWGKQLIQDGPIIAAEEFENFSSFPNGKRRSKIILIADSTLLQGQCPHYRSDTISGNQSFIRSLYPDSPDSSNGADTTLRGGELMSDGGNILDVNSRFVPGKNWKFTQKLRAPERGTPAKYAAISGSAIGSTMIPAHLWGGNGVAGGLNKFSDNEDSYDPTTLYRPEEIKEEERIKKEKEKFFDNALSTYGMYPRFSGDFLDITNYRGGIYVDYDQVLFLDEKENKNFITDGNIGGGLTDLMRIEGTDYLDYDIFNSGYPGDLFGYSVDISDGKLIVGAPYNAFHAETAISGISGVVAWHEIKNGESGSGIRIGADGGAGAAFVFNYTGSGKNAIAEFLPWEFTQKIKPSNVNVGIYDFTAGPILTLTQQRGPHQIGIDDFITDYAGRGDRFGFSVAIDCDMVAIGAPNHDYETLHHHIYSGVVAYNGSGLSTAFQRKSFNAEYDIPLHSYYDLADSGIRVDLFENNSGTMILNAGAVYNYRNEMTDFQNRKQSWIFAEKLYAVGYNTRVQTDIDIVGLGEVELVASGNENDNFGTSVSINRARRGDSDYTLVVGSPRHDWPTSGNHPTSGLVDAGAAFTFDAMLRGQIPSIPNEGGWIDAHVFGQKKSHEDQDRLDIRVNQNTTGGSIEHKISGIIISNQNGDVFLEVSGFDPSVKGFVAHRPYVEKIEFELVPGTPDSGIFPLYVSGLPSSTSGNMNMTVIGPDSAIVYNNVDLNMFGVSGVANSGMNMFVEVASGQSSGILNMSVASTQTTGILPLRMRGY